MAEITLPDDDMLLHLSRGDYISAKRHWMENLSGQPVEEHGIPPDGIGNGFAI